MKNKNFMIALCVAVWAALIGIGFVRLTDYSSRPGKPANVSPKLPAEIFHNAKENLPKLVIFIHPRCPCSRSTLNELARIVANQQNKMEIKIFFYKPEKESSEWIKTDLWETARIIPGVEIAAMNEEEIEKFGVITSGQVILYDTKNEVVFSGGITLGRGHEGKSDGRITIEDYLETRKIYAGETPVFGCLLTSKEITFP